MCLALGGMTVAEMRDRLSNAEMTRWLAYRRRHGPLNYERRYDRVAALPAYVTAMANGGKGDLKDFMPWPQKTDVENEIDRWLDMLT